jgi:hypothetical protein
MSSLTHRRNPNLSAPPESDPEAGVVGVANLPLLEAVRWVDTDGIHVVESTECDVSGSGESLWSAIDDLVMNSFSLAAYLASLIREGEATDREIEVHALLSERISPIAQRLDEARRRDVLISMMRDAVRSRSLRRQSSKHAWQPTHLQASRKLSHA